jgi:UDP-glucose 4-epimerase
MPLRLCSFSTRASTLGPVCRGALSLQPGCSEVLGTLLITGGAGFIGSHTCLVLLEGGHQLVVLDNFANSSPESLRRVQELAGPAAADRLTVVEGDIRSGSDLERAFAARAAGGPIEAVIHFAGLKAVGESVQHPLRYWDVNVAGSGQLLAAMQTHGCRTLVFSSSATLYGIPEQVPIPETAPVQPINPYGHSKAAVERMLADLAASEPGWRIARLRYFNPVGAHPSGRIGEDPNGIPNNLFPFVSQVAVGRRERLQVFGGDWPTPDGSGVRDYIHVMDLAEGHRAALEVLLAEAPQLLTLNLGSGQGHSVLEVVAAFAQACARPVPYAVVERRPGDAASTVADPSLAADRLGWRTSRSLAEMCRDGWAWQSANPHGYSA